MDPCNKKKISVIKIAARGTFLTKNSSLSALLLQLQTSLSVCRIPPYRILTPDLDLFFLSPNACFSWGAPVVKRGKVRDVWRGDCTHMPLSVAFPSSSCCFSYQTLSAVWRLNYHSRYCSTSPNCPCFSLAPPSAPPSFLPPWDHPLLVGRLSFANIVTQNKLNK